MTDESLASFSFFLSAISILPPLYSVWSQTRSHEMEREAMSQAEVPSPSLTSSPTTLPRLLPLQPHFPTPGTCLPQDSALASSTACNTPSPAWRIPPFRMSFDNLFKEPYLNSSHPEFTLHTFQNPLPSIVILLLCTYHCVTYYISPRHHLLLYIALERKLHE